MSTCLKASLNPSQRLISEIDLKEVKKARHILWELVNKKVPADKPSVSKLSQRTGRSACGAKCWGFRLMNINYN